jgi:hypothetical protein
LRMIVIRVLTQMIKNKHANRPAYLAAKDRG